MKFPCTRRIRRVSLSICSALGAGAGCAFAADIGNPFNLMFATFLWTLIVGSAAAILTSHNGSIKHGDWRAGMRVSATIYFANSTGFLLALLICAALGPAQEVAGALFTLPTMARIVAPGIYFAASVLTLCSIVFYRRAPSPAYRGRERD